MNGMYELKVCGEFTEYRLTIEYNLTFIKGDSGIGKTQMVSLINQYNRFIANNENPEDYGISVSVKRLYSDESREIKIIDGTSLTTENLLKLKDTIVVLDEQSEIINTDSLNKILKRGKVYIIAISRIVPANISLNVKAVLTFQTVRANDKINSLGVNSYRFITQTVPYYKHSNKEKFLINQIYTEDSKTGKWFFQKFIGEDIDCDTRVKSTNGKGGVLKVILDYNKEEDCMIVVDGANFVSEMERIYTLEKFPNNVIIELPESFEWLLMKVVEHSSLIEDKLTNTYNFIEYSRYITWERFYSALIKEVIPNYRKGKQINEKIMNNIDKNKLFELFNRIDFTLIDK